MGTDGTAALQLPLPPFGRDVQPHTLGSAASSQIHLCGPTVFIPIEFFHMEISELELPSHCDLEGMLLLYSQDQAHC